MSSANRFAPLAESSSSKEKESSVPNTDITDQTMRDASQAGSSSGAQSLSMSNLKESLPTTHAGRVAYVHKRRAEFEAEQESKRSRSGPSSEVAVRQIPSAAPEPVDIRKAEEKFDPRVIINPAKHMKCAFKYSDGYGHDSATIGNIFTPDAGFSIRLEADAGRFGAASLSLLLRINKGDKNIPLSTNRDDYHEVRITWRAGLIVEGRQAIQNLHFSHPKGPGFPHDQTIVESCPKERQDQLSNLMGLVFECTFAQISPADRRWFDGLSNAFKDGFHALFFGEGPHIMTMWFIGRPSSEDAYINWGRFLETAANSNKIAFWQYLSPEGDSILPLDEMEPISTFQNGMYAKYDWQRDAAGKRIKQANGQFVEDRSKIIGYHKFEKQLNWVADYEFGVYNVVPVIRDTQFEVAQVAHFGGGVSLVNLQKLPALQKSKAKDTKAAKDPNMPENLVGVYRAFVKIVTPGAAPPPHAKVRCEWDNSDPNRGKPHIWAKESKDVWWGKVMPRMEVACRATGTDFCVLFNKPARGTPPQTYSYVDNERFPDQSYVLARLQIEIDQTSAKREIAGMIKLAVPTTDERLAAPRMALMSEPSRLPNTVTNLTELNPEVWSSFEQYCDTKYQGNKEQLEMALSLKAVKNRLTACIGPPGTGKTEVLTDAVTASIMCGFPTLVCAVSNNAVDKAANSCWNKFPADLRSKYKFLRYETGSAEMQAILTRPDFEDTKGGDPNARPKYEAPTAIDDDEVFTQTFARAVYEEDEHANALKVLYDKHRNYSVALEQKAILDARKQSNVPSAMTLPNRMHALTCQDTVEANADLQAEVLAYTSEKMDAAAIEVERQKGQEHWRTEAALAALAQDKLDPAEIEARVNDGRIPSVNARDRSYQYRTKLREYRSKKGRLTREQKNEFKRLRMEVVIRVFEETNVVFTSCNNAGSEMVTLGFSPKTIWIDEAGQLTVAGLANVLTSFTSWLVATIFGDTNQLLPFVLSGKMNEFMANALLSVLALLEEKGYPILRLRQQYRMAPSIVRWVAKYFYKGQLMNHSSVGKDNKYRELARDISKRVYKIEGPRGNGSEYWMVDVVNGISQVQHNGTSLHNSANADAIAQLVDEGLAKGLQPSEISVLVYYTGQLDLVIHKIEAKTQANGRTWQFGVGRVSSVDAFQGEENEFVLIDVVVAHPRGQQNANRQGDNLDAEGSDDDDNLEGVKNSGTVTAHVKSPNRLCCALTRGKNCVVVFCQLATIIGTAKAKQSMANAAISAMAHDFIDRRLVYHDYDHLDTTPVSVEQRAKWDEAKLAEERRMKEVENMSLLSTFSKSVRPSKHVGATQANAPQMYRTNNRRTTRPNMSGPVAETAEKHDGRTLATEAGTVVVNTRGQTQHASKMTRKARRQERQKEAEAKAAEDAKGKGKAIAAPAEDKAQGVTVPPTAAPVEGKGKGKEKEKEDDTEMT